LLIAGLALVLVHAAPQCGAQTTGPDAWGAEIAQPEPQSKPAPSRPGKSKSPAKRDGTGRLGLTGDQTATLARIELASDTQYDVFTLPNPYRVVIEMAGTATAEPVSKGEAHGLVERYHSGRFAQGKSRIVMETLGPVKATLFPAETRPNDRIIVEVALTPMPVKDFGEGSGSLNAPKTTAAVSAPAAETAELPDGALPAAPARPVIVIDPGHGGIDPGAVGAESLLEKNIVMAVAEKLQQALVATDRYRVHMTRTTDTFVSLDQRVGYSRQRAANLFISLHADSIEAVNNADSISGATVYTLSERASDEQSRKMAEKENASDLLGGIAVNSGEDHEVKDILIDLIKRETASFSAEFAGVLRANLGKSVPMSRDPMRSAAFKVLKQPHAPSVLLELGYMSNASDAKRLNSPQWQSKVAKAIASAVDAYFSSRTARAR
jgi:N-acetylmuramoyl-L-alanine amidase